MKNIKKKLINWSLLIFIITGTFISGLLSDPIVNFSHAESDNSRKQPGIVDINLKNKQWQSEFPDQYNSWAKTKEMDFKSKYFGSIPYDMLEKRPSMVILWAGYAFSREYSIPRGHMYSIDDVRSSLRTGTPKNGKGDLQPAACWSCKSPDTLRVMQEKGAENFYQNKWSTFGSDIVNPVGCADCHNPASMELTVTRLPLIEALKQQKKDISQTTPQEIRSLVCAQCHSEYYFKGDGKCLVFPWDKGITAEDIEKYYDEADFADWIHAISKTPMIKAQHPDYELFLLGIHGQNDVTCADCHMSEISDNGAEYSNHHITSPLKDVSYTCQTCHNHSEEELREYVYRLQNEAFKTRDRIETELAKAHIMAKIAWDNGATSEEMTVPQKLLRQAQWRWDFVAASHGASFHAPAESQRLFGVSLEKSLLAQAELQKILSNHRVETIQLPDISTKKKAQAYIGLDIDKLETDKEKWLKTIVPQWIREAVEKGFY